MATAKPAPGPAPGPTIFVLFGATGDLAKRMVLPAFYQLAQQGLLPKRWRLVGNGRGDVSHEDFRTHVHDALTEFGPKPEPGEWDQFSQHVFFAGGGFSTDQPGRLLDVLADARQALGGDPQLIHYLAVPPVAFGELTKALGQHNLARGARVVYEKPFGTSQRDFRLLDRIVHSVLDEQQVYRIDHFLGKEATQDLHLLRFANGLFAAGWSRQYIDSVQIDVPEKLGITDRSRFYDATGAVLDMLVTHLFQVAAEVAMEPPASLGALDLQAAREKVISSFRPLDPAEVVLGQFDGYRDVPGVAPGSTMDTFVAARLWIDNSRWRGVPFYLRTGKRMPQKLSQIVIHFKEPSHYIFAPEQRLQISNKLIIRLQPDEGISLRVMTKEQGLDKGMQLRSGPLQLNFSDTYRSARIPDAYERLLLEVMHGNQNLFVRKDEIEAAWKWCDQLIAGWKKSGDAPKPYAAGSWGPMSSIALITRDGRSWYGDI